MARSHSIIFLHHTFIALLLGIGAALMVIGNDAWVKNYVGTFIKQSYARSFNCSMNADIERVNFLFPSVEFSNVLVSPRGGNGWLWQAQRMIMSFSWLQLLRLRAFDVYVQFDGLKAQSQLVDNYPSIMEHINLLIYSSSPVPVTLKSLILNNATLMLEDSKREGMLKVAWSSESKNKDHRFSSTMRFADGSCTLKGDCYASALQGVGQIEARHAQGKVQIDATTDCTLELPHLPDQKRCSIAASLQDNNATVAIANADQSCVVQCTIGEKKSRGFEIKGKARLPIAALAQACGASWMKSLQGVATVDGCAYLSGNQNGAHRIPFDFQGNVILCPAVNNESAGTYTISCMTRDAALHGLISGSAPLLGTVKGEVNLASDGSVALHLAAQDTIHNIFAQGWAIDPRALTMRLDVDRRGALRSSCALRANHKDKKKSCEITAAYSLDSGKQSCKATINGKELFHVDASSGKDALRGTIAVASLKELIALVTGYEMQGEGTLKTALAFDSPTKIDLELASGSTLRVPQTYNVIQGLRAQFVVDSRERTVAMHNFLCSFHKGFLRSDHAIARFDEHNRLAYAHLPLSVDSCLLSFKKDLFAMVTGHLIGTYGPKGSHVDGSLAIEHCQLHENIFSPSFAQQLRAYAGSQVATMTSARNTCDITVETMTPVIIKTPLLETAAKANFHITDSLLAPKIAGSISLLSGTLYFPYKPLHISKGSLIFMPQKPFDPLIELMAKNMIKHYRVSLQLTGSLEDPNIIIESSPALTQEQIVALLLVGSPDDSLNVVMPTLLMQNLTNIVFSDKQTPTGLAFAFNKLLLPFKRIHVTPRFTDQTARGGLRGALDIEVNDRLHASIEKNFSLSEDTRFEADYLLSDDVSVRAIRNERRDVSGEVEMRWKF